ncbi:MAG: hypothetical protein ACP6IY_19325 [Promethearchaeia archaeon]
MRTKIRLVHFANDLVNDKFSVLISSRVRRTFWKGKSFDIFYKNQFLGYAKVIRTYSKSNPIIDAYNHCGGLVFNIIVELEWIAKNKLEIKANNILVVG